MDPGTILAVVQITDRVLSLIAKYYSDVKNAQKDIEGLTTEVEAFSNVLRRIQLLVQSSSHATKLPLSASLVATIQGARSDIENIKNQLDPSKGTAKKVMSRIGFRALKWPFTKEEVKEHIARLERHKTIISLALSSDQT